MTFKADVSMGYYTLHTQVSILPLKLLHNKNIRIIFKKTPVLWADMFYSINSILIHFGQFCTFIVLNVTTDWLDFCVGAHKKRISNISLIPNLRTGIVVSWLAV